MGIENTPTEYKHSRAKLLCSLFWFGYVFIYKILKGDMSLSAAFHSYSCKAAVLLEYFCYFVCLRNI